MIRDWLRRRLGIQKLEARLDFVRGHVLYLNQWVLNLDAALQQLQKSNEPADIRKLAGEIRERVMAVKATFPTNVRDIK